MHYCTLARYYVSFLSLLIISMQLSLVICLLCRVVPDEGDRLAVGRTRERGERGNNMGVAGDEEGGLDEDAKRATQFR